MTSSSERPSLGFSLLAGALSPLAVPLALAGLAWLSRDFGHGLGLVQAFAEGGSGMYAVLALGAVASVVNAAAVYTAVERPLALGVLPFGSVTSVAVGTFFFRRDLLLSVEAVTMAGPFDREVILNGSRAEASWTLVFGLLLAGTLLVMAGAGVLLGWLARRSAGRTVAGVLPLGLGAISAGLWALFAAAGERAVADAYHVLSMAVPAARLAAVTTALTRAQFDSSAEHGLLGVCVAVSLLLFVVPRVSGLAKVGVALWLAVVLIGMNGALAVAHRVGRVVEEAFPRMAPALLELEAELAERPWGVVIDSSLLWNGTPYEGRLTSTCSQGGTLQVALGRAASADLLHTTLQRAADEGITEVSLVGQHTTVPPAGLVVPSGFEWVFSPPAGFTFNLARDAEQECGGECSWGTLTERGLEVAGEVWPLETQSRLTTVAQVPLYVALKRYELPVLLGGLHAAVSHGRRLVLAPHEEVQTSGPFKQEAIRHVIDLNRVELRRCYETLFANADPPDGKVLVEFVVGTEGKVVSARVLESPGVPDLDTCLLERIKQWQFPAPNNGNVVVKFPIRVRWAKQL